MNIPEFQLHELPLENEMNPLFRIYIYSFVFMLHKHNAVVNSLSPSVSVHRRRRTSGEMLRPPARLSADRTNCVLEDSVKVIKDPKTRREND